MSDLLKQFQYLLVPFAKPRENFVDPLIIMLTVVWTAIVVGNKLELGENLPLEDIGILSSVLGTTLGFLLPLYLSDCIEKNRSGITLYDAYCGDVVALAWEIAAYGDEVVPLNEENARVARQQLDNDMGQANDGPGYKQLRSDLFRILKQMPMVIKHVFRDDFTFSKMDDEWVAQKMREVNPDESLAIESIMFLLVIKIRRMPLIKKQNGGNVLQIMMKKWNDIYNSYGSTASLIQYTEPRLFQNVLYTAMALYVFILPFTFSIKDNDHNIWLAGLVIYFFISLNSAGKLLRNPFRSLKDTVQVFATVTDTSNSTVRLLKNIENYKKGDDIYSMSRMETRNPSVRYKMQFF